MTNAVTITAQPGTPFIDIVREFDAPIADVRRAYTDPELVKQWLGPRRLKMEIEEYDVRTGGSWSYVHRDADGSAYGFRGVFHSVTDDQMLQTFEFDGFPGHVSLERATFEGVGEGRARVSVHAVYQSIEDRDGMIASGMEGGLTEGYERLDELLAASERSRRCPCRSFSGAQ